MMTKTNEIHKNEVDTHIVIYNNEYLTEKRNLAEDMSALGPGLRNKISPSLENIEPSICDKWQETAVVLGLRNRWQHSHFLAKRRRSYMMNEAPQPAITIRKDASPLTTMPTNPLIPPTVRWPEYDHEKHFFPNASSDNFAIRMAPRSTQRLDPVLSRPPRFHAHGV
jgi:hypothetical protein